MPIRPEGDGDDRLTGSHVFVVGDAHVETGDGNDRPEFIGSGAWNMSFSMGTGDDRLYLDADTISGSLTVVLGEGANDAQVVNSTILGSLAFVGGGSVDQLRTDNTRVDANLVAVMGTPMGSVTFQTQHATCPVFSTFPRDHRSFLSRKQGLKR